LAGRGDFLLIVADQMIRFQAARIPLEEITALCAAPLHANKPTQQLGGFLRRIK
jgi:hypothetical protein